MCKENSFSMTALLMYWSQVNDIHKRNELHELCGIDIFAWYLTVHCIYIKSNNRSAFIKDGCVFECMIIMNVLDVYWCLSCRACICVGWAIQDVKRSDSKGQPHRPFMLSHWWLQWCQSAPVYLWFKGTKYISLIRMGNVNHIDTQQSEFDQGSRYKVMGGGGRWGCMAMLI